jgi:hypothetical protein
MVEFSQAKKMSKQDWQEALAAVAQKTVKIDDSAVSDIVKKLS